MLNIFRLLGDMSHTASILMLLLKLRASKSAAGISLKTQELFLVVFVSRYMDIIFRFYSLYNSMFSLIFSWPASNKELTTLDGYNLMKIFYISLTAAIIYTIRETIPIKATYDKSQDSFFHWKFAVAPCAVLGVIVNTWDLGFKGFFNILNLLWVFSECLEPMAIVPQLIVLQRYREVENLTGHYVFLLGAYRLLYILNWVYRAYHEERYVHRPLLYFAATVQTLLYVDFFYYYALSTPGDASRFLLDPMVDDCNDEAELKYKKERYIPCRGVWLLILSLLLVVLAGMKGLRERLPLIRRARRQATEAFESHGDEEDRMYRESYALLGEEEETA